MPKYTITAHYCVEGVDKEQKTHVICEATNPQEAREKHFSLNTDGMATITGDDSMILITPTNLAAVEIHRTPTHGAMPSATNMTVAGFTR
ncbi:MAG: hypothetical protein H8F28_03680 [Fibrella sp.]|nr:hypothetical protein [Armatimonadota bacterium]